MAFSPVAVTFSLLNLDILSFTLHFLTMHAFFKPSFVLVSCRPQRQMPAGAVVDAGCVREAPCSALFEHSPPEQDLCAVSWD